MRKLVKKLALVLALVLAFACFAPASAQAAEVRRSWNFAVGEYKPTLEMEVEENFALELLDNGDTIDASIYDVAYYSKSDALEVNKLTGYAKAKAAENDVPIAAVVTNKITGNSVKVWALVDIAAKEVVATPTATATATATPVPTKAPFALISAKQISTNQLVLTFNDDAKNVSKADLEIKYSLKEGSSAMIKCYIKGALSISGNEVTVTLYENMKDSTFVYASYKNSTAKSFKVSVGEVSSIEIVTTQVTAGDDKFYPVKIKLFDENGILLKTLNAGDEMPNGAYCEISLVGAENEDGEEIAYVTGACEIYFHEEGETVLVKAEYHTGEFDDEGNEIIWDAAGEVSSIDTTPYVKAAAWGVTTKAIGKSKEASFGDKYNELCVGDTGVRLAGKLTVVTPRLDQSDKTETKYTEESGYTDLVYETSDATILLVDTNGWLVPVSEGEADIIVRYAPTTNVDGEEVIGDVIGVYTIKVEEERYVDSVTTDYSASKTVSTKDTAKDSVTIKVTAKDQHGDTYSLAKMLDKVKLVQLTTSDKLTKLVEDGFVSIVNDSGKAKITIKGNNGAAVVAGTYRFRIEINGVKTATFTIAFKDAKDDAASYELVASKSSVEVKVQKLSDMNSKAPVVTLTAWAYDASKVKIETVDIVDIVDKENKTVTPGSLWYDVTVPEGVDKDAFVEALSINKDGVLEFDPYTNRPNSSDNEWAPESWPVGEYIFTLYTFNNSYRIADTVTVKVTNGQESLTATLDKITSEVSYDTVMSGVTVTNGKFTATVTTGSALINAIIKNSSSDADYCVVLKDGSTEIIKANNGGTYEVVEISGYADGKKTVVISSITVKKTYSGKTTKELKVTISGGSISFAD